jgi:hypothetical protein
MVASAAPIAVTLGAATFGTTGTGSTVNGSASTSTLDLKTTSTAASNANLDVVNGILNYQFFKIGTVTLNEIGNDAGISSNPNETNNLGTFTINFGLTVAGQLQAVSISSLAWTANAGQDSTLITFAPHPGLTINFANGAKVEAVIYAAPNFGANNSISLDSQSPTSQDVYVKLGLLQAPTSGVPEPGSMALLGSGLVGLGFIARRRMAKN